jgi:hypothetical protein
MSKPKELKALTKALADVLAKEGAGIKSLEFEFEPKHFKEFADNGGWDGGNVYRYHFGFQGLPTKGGDTSKAKS